MSAGTMAAAPIEAPRARAGPPVPALARQRMHDASGRRVPLAACATLATWLGCLAVGSLGLLLQYPRAGPAAHAPAPPPVEAVERVQVELAGGPAPPEIGAAPSDSPPAPAQVAPPPEAPPPPPPAAPEVPAVPDAPPLVAVAMPSPDVAFAVPVEGPSRVVDARSAAPSAPAPATSAPAAAPRPPAQGSAGAPGRSTGAPVRHLTFGVGEGQQPAPAYPREAVLAREQGTVVVRFTVGEDGRVASAEVTQASRWPRLNQAAVGVVRDRWRFGPGPVRTFDVPIEFQLTLR